MLLSCFGNYSSTFFKPLLDSMSIYQWISDQNLSLSPLSVHINLNPHISIYLSLLISIYQFQSVYIYQYQSVYIYLCKYLSFHFKQSIPVCAYLSKSTYIYLSIIVWRKVEKTKFFLIYFHIYLCKYLSFHIKQFIPVHECISIYSSLFVSISTFL